MSAPVPPTDLDAASIEAAHDRSAYAAGIRRNGERLALIVTAVATASAALPIVEPEDAPGVLATALLLLGLVVVWFHALPKELFGDRRLLIFALALEPVLVVLLLAKGVGSAYLAYLLLPVILTIYAPRGRHSAIVAAAAAAMIVAIGLLRPSGHPSAEVARWIGNALTMLGIFTLTAVMIGEALRSARRLAADRLVEIARSAEVAHKLAISDKLTGLFNRFHGDVMLAQLVQEADRGRGFSLLAVDIDGMKRINDGGGHAAGDAALVAIADVLRLTLRGMDTPVRTGGDEFVALLPDTDETQARRVAERLRFAIEVRNAGKDEAAAVRASIGVATWKAGDTAADVLACADAALYRVKSSAAT